MICRRNRPLWGAAIVNVCLLASEARAEFASFSNWLEHLRIDALRAGVSQQTLDLTTGDLSSDPRVLALQQRQPETTQRFVDYLQTRVTPRRIQEAQEHASKYHSLLKEIGAHYGVQPRFIVALWGLESDFGRATGTWSTVRSLATLAHGGRRRDYFRRELIALLRIIDSQPDKYDMMGSWAGALGQCQFMPSNVPRIAVDYDKDGRTDIWESEADVLASIANYLSRSGWRDNETWGREVTLPGGFDNRLVGHDVRLKLGKWSALGLRRTDGRYLPKRDLWTSLLLPDGLGTRAFLVYEDFRTLLKWNRSDHFALSVGLLSENLR